MNITNYVDALAPVLVSAVHILGAIAVTAHAVLNKRQANSVIGWVGLAWLAPVFGSIAYLLLGINRIRRRAADLRHNAPVDIPAAPAAGRATPYPSIDHAGASHGQLPLPTLSGLQRLGEHVTGKPLLAGNRIRPLRNGDETFPAMLAAIDAASRSVTLASYIFDADSTGKRFEAALIAAVARGVEVRVLIDAVGARYSRQSMIRRLKRAGVPVAAFLPTRVPWRFRYANLRNHRKILVVDGHLAFVGGTNIRDAHWLAQEPPNPAACLHFDVCGPVVAQLQQTFAADWAFSTRETLAGPDWFPPLEPCGPVFARGIADGPDEDLDKILEFLLGALATATERVRIITPYLVLDNVLHRTLEVTAMRGVAVDIVVPVRSNLPLLDWAMASQFATLLTSGCRIHLAPAPFDHSKLFVVDRAWSLIGSTNWDPRSLRLNFEFNLECYDATLCACLDDIAEAKIARAEPLTLDRVSGWPLPVRLRNGLVRLLAPYL